MANNLKRKPEDTITVAGAGARVDRDLQRDSPLSQADSALLTKYESPPPPLPPQGADGLSTRLGVVSHGLQREARAELALTVVLSVARVLNPGPGAAFKPANPYW